MEYFSIKEFNQLTNKEKYGLIEDYGVYLDIKRKEEQFEIALFSLYDYYVQVWLNIKTDQLKQALAFDSYKQLDPFLNEIDITPVYSML